LEEIVLETYQDIFKQLNSSSIQYCSWKNNHLLDQSLIGLRDLDLLVDINRLKDFEVLLRQHGFAEFIPPRPSSRCIRHYYKLDAVDGILCHLHVYFRIITGESLFKNYQLPFEKAILQNSFLNASEIQECNPSHQLQLYAIRQFIKCSSLPSLLTVIRDRKDYSAERNYIDNAIGLNKDQPSTNFGLTWVDKLQPSFKHSCLAGLAIRHQYKSYRLRTGFSSILGSYGGLFELVFRRLLGKKGKRCAGMIVSLVGLDGSGKSSAVDELSASFGSVLSVKKMHFGRPPCSLVTSPAWFALQLYKNLKKSGSKPSSTSVKKNTGIVHALRLVSLASDRYRVMATANTLRGRGFLVLMDRCPVETIGCMDAPKIEYEGNSAIMKWLMVTERKYYLKMATVDHAIFMKASVDTAIARNNARTKSAKETDEEIRERFRQNAHATFVASVVHEVDTEKELVTVRREVKALVWGVLAASN
jgi:thymidylate kinase